MLSLFRAFTFQVRSRSPPYSMLEEINPQQKAAMSVGTEMLRFDPELRGIYLYVGAMDCDLLELLAKNVRRINNYSHWQLLFLIFSKRKFGNL